jgi:hypothetical protein
LELKPFGGSCGVREFFPCPRDQAIHERIIAIEVVVEQRQSLHTMFLGDAHAPLP